MHELARVGIELTDGRIMSIKGRVPKVDHRKHPFIALRFPGTNVDPEFIWERDRLDYSTGSIRLQVHNTTKNPLFVEKMIVYTASVAPTFIGFINSKEQAGYFEIQPCEGKSHITAFTRPEKVMIFPGEKMSSETLLVSFDRDPQTAVERYTKSAPVPLLTERVV